MSRSRISEATPLFPVLFFLAWTGALLHFYFHNMHLWRKCTQPGWWGNLKERDHQEALHSDVTIWEWYCCVYIATCHLLRWVLLLQTAACLSPAQIVSMLQHIPHTEIGTVMSILLNVTYWDIGSLMCPYCNILSPAKAGTIMSTYCHLLRLVLSHPYGNILSPVETGTIMYILQYLAITCSDWYHHIHSACWMQSTVQLYTYSCATKHYYHYGVRNKCLVWSAADWNLNENCIRKHSMAVICTWHLAFSAAHCMSGITDIRCQTFNFDISNSLKCYTGAKLLLFYLLTRKTYLHIKTNTVNW